MLKGRSSFPWSYKNTLIILGFTCMVRLKISINLSAIHSNEENQDQKKKKPRLLLTFGKGIGLTDFITIVY